MWKCGSLSNRTLVYLQSLMPRDLGFKTALPKKKKELTTEVDFRAAVGTQVTAHHFIQSYGRVSEGQ